MIGKALYFILFYCLPGVQNHAELLSLNPFLSCKTEMNVTKLFQTSGWRNREVKFTGPKTNSFIKKNENQKNSKIKKKIRVAKNYSRSNSNERY